MFSYRLMNLSTVTLKISLKDPFQVPQIKSTHKERRSRSW
ncbi:hypothetical protein ES319_D11G142900v1 [Gossypium barbadense]|uniref:Uncharacterized protein n=1 Tax=Gossypium barbadense TaxID=3634 RepID=A0A5J5PB01_GOSBA|nr:hypothetical protein ES319_D11G142900v1 [Gossypium barbadense]